MRQGCASQGEGTKLSDIPNGVLGNVIAKQCSPCLISHLHRRGLVLTSACYPTPSVAFHLGKISGKDEFMAMFHRLLYGKPGKVRWSLP